MKVVVTGSSGHLGEALCLTLQRKGIDYIGIDIKTGKFTTHIGTISDMQFVNGVFENISHVIHTATLHKPHIVTHSKQDFIDTNVTGTLNLLEASRLYDVKGFIFTSTTSTFGDMLRPSDHLPSIWIEESVKCIPKNIYGVTKTTAEDLCKLYYRNHKLPCVILRTSRFFLEEDDKKELREAYQDANIKANEYLFKRVDIEDVVSAHLMALNKVSTIGFQKYIISASSPFKKEDLEELHIDASKVLLKYYPNYQEIYTSLQWKMFPKIERVYVNDKARKQLGWTPTYDFQHVLDCIKNETDFRSTLAVEIGIKGYHEASFESGPYPVTE